MSARFPQAPDAQRHPPGSERERRAFEMYFTQLTAVSLAMVDLRAAYAAPLWEAEFYARSVNCAWAVLEARRTVLETITGDGSLSCPGIRFVRDRLREVLQEGWANAARQPADSEALVCQLRRLEERLTLPTPAPS